MCIRDSTNTLIIEDSQRYGLAQMYQLKGRVGRSSTQAYAYFMFPEHVSLKMCIRDSPWMIQRSRSPAMAAPRLLRTSGPVSYTHLSMAFLPGFSDGVHDTRAPRPAQ